MFKLQSKKSLKTTATFYEAISEEFGKLQGHLTCITIIRCNTKKYLNNFFRITFKNLSN